MHPLLNHNLYLVKEHAGLFKAASNYDIFDPATGEQILQCREENLNPLVKALRFTDYKRNTPFDSQVRTMTGEPVLRVSRGISLMLSKVKVHNEQDEHVGGFQQKLFSIGGKFNVLDTDGEAVCTLKGRFTGWNFKFAAGDTELAQVSKKWAGIGKELFTTADNYMIEIHDTVPPDSPMRTLIIAAVMCIDLVLKE